MKFNTEPVRGTKDFLPAEVNVREYARSIILETYKKFGFSQIVTPVMEDICTLLGSDGGDNLKLIFKILKRGEKLDLSQPNLKEIDIVDIGLRYDLTVPLVRMFSNNQAKLPLPFKSIQIGDSFRADRPQRGRLRQFIQCDIDIIGDPTVNAEIDILNTTAKTYLALGFSGFEIKINDRRILSEIISQIGFEKEKEEDICISLDKYDKIGIDGIKAELVEKGYNGVLVVELMQTISKIVSGGIESLAKVGVSKPVIDSLSKIINTVKELSKGQFDIKFDVSIIRGQGYYTGTVYELYIKNFSGACGGGGRYDNMIEKMTGKNIPAVGYSIGFEPTCMLLVENNMIKIKNNTTAVVYKEEDDFLKVLQLVESLNQTGNASAVPARKNLNFQLESLKQNGFTHYVLFEKGEVKPLS